MDWFGTVRARLGVLASDRFLVFGTAGLAYGETEASSTLTSVISAVGSTSIFCVAGTPCLGSQATKISAGWTAGGGGEWAIADKWRFKVEYLHVALADQTLLLVMQPPASGNGTVTARFHNQFDIVRAGFNIRY